jgi:integrase
MKRTPSVSLFLPITMKYGVKVTSKIWWMRWRQDGRDCRESTGTRNKKRATRLAVERMQAFERGETVLRQITWTKAKEEFVKHKASVCRSSTPDTYGWSLAAFERIAKPSNLARVDVRMLQRFAAGRSDEDCSAATVNKDLRAVRAFLRWAVEQRYIWTVPAFKTAWVRADIKQPVVIPLAEYQGWLAALDSGKLRLTKRPAAWWKVFAQLAYWLGMRRGEILGLCWSMVDLEKAELTVLSETSKGRRWRTLPLVPELVAVLQEWRQSCPDEDHVLPYSGNMRHLYEDWHKIAGKHRVPKNCRSTCGSQLVESGTPTVVVKDFLGHSSVTTTEKFYVNTSASLRKAAEARKAVD